MKNDDKASSNIVPFPQTGTAPQDVIENDLYDEVENYYLSYLKQQAVKSAPRYKLFEILPKITVVRLRDMYRAHFIKPAASKLKKQELIDALLPILTDELELEFFIKRLPDMEWKFFQDALAAKELKSIGLINGAQAAVSDGFASMFYDKEQFIFLVPEEVKETYRKIDKPSLHQHMGIKSWLNMIACAAVNLYGVLSLEELAEIINKLNKFNSKKIKVTPDLIDYMLEGYDFYNLDYRITEGYIANYEFSDIHDDNYLDMDEVLNLLKKRKGKPRYLPDLETFLYYEDPDYYDQTHHIKALNKALLEEGLSMTVAQDLIDNLHFQITQEDGMPELLSTLEEYNMSMESEHANEIIQHIMDVHNSTRLWSNYGHTPDELMKIMDKQQPRAIHFGPGLEKMFVDGKLTIGDFERSSMGDSLINDEFKDSFLSEIARMKSLVDKSTLPKNESRTVPTKKPGRNDPCPCGSGLKYKKCCGKNGPKPD